MEHEAYTEVTVKRLVRMPDCKHTLHEKYSDTTFTPDQMLETVVYDTASGTHRYRVEVRGPAYTKTGKVHATHRGLNEYVDRPGSVHLPVAALPTPLVSLLHGAHRLLATMQGVKVQGEPTAPVHVPEPATQERHEEGLYAARNVAQWHLGDANWADEFVDAYLQPTVALEKLRAEGVDWL